MRRLLVLLLALSAVLAGAGPVAAEAPSALTGQVTDTAGVLDDDAAQQHLNDLRSSGGVGLWVVFVDTFDGAAGRAWAQQAYRASSLGPEDVVLAVAVGQRQYGFWSGPGLSRSAVQGVVDRDVVPRLAASDWDGAVAAAADGLADVGGTGTSSGDGSTGGSGTGSSGGSGGGSGLGALVLLLAVLAGGVLLVLALLSRARRRRASGAGAGQAQQPAGPPPVSTQELDQRANAALVATDDAVDRSAEELGFARAEFGDEAARPFEAALESARADLAAAFAARQRLEDPDLPEAERRAVLEEVLRRCAAADAALDAQTEAFESLRGLERDLPRAMADAERALAALAERAPAERARLDALQSRYTSSALAGARGTPEQVDRLLELARAELAQAHEHSDSGARGEAAADVQAARAALVQVGTLLDGVGRLEQDLASAGSALAASRAETETDLAEARAVLRAGGGGPGLAGLVARAEAALAAASDAASDTGGGDPLTAQRRLAEADAALDAGLADVREQGQRAERARAALATALPAARAEVAAARDFVRTRRGAVGSRARTLAAQAEALLSQAEAAARTDPAAALAAAQQADAMAEQAQAQAQDDLDRWDGPGYGGGYGGGYRRGGVVYGGGGGFEGAVLGGVLGGILSGGSHHGGGMGGMGGGFGGGFGGGGGFDGGGGGGGGGSF